jgi:hypothetical protein
MKKCSECKWLKYDEYMKKKFCLLTSTYEADEKESGLRDENDKLVDEAKYGDIPYALGDYGYEASLIIPDPETFGCARFEDGR